GRRAGRPGLRRSGCACSCHGLAVFGDDGQLHLEGCTLAEPGLDPDAPAVHLHDLLGDGEAEAGAAFGLGVGAVDLMKLLEDALLLVDGDARSRVSHTHGKMAVYHGRADAHLTLVGELDGIANEVEEDLGEALLVADANRQSFSNLAIELELL